MTSEQKLINTAKKAVKASLSKLSKFKISYKNFYKLKNVQKEIKSEIDMICEKIIINELKKTSITILSEESESLNFENHNDLLWVVDPLDGTVNYIRGIGNCTVSIALYKNKRPVFGVIGEYPSGTITWGGPKIGSYTDSKKIKVSNTRKKSNSILCTGFPARYKFNHNNEKEFFKLIRGFAKIRMLGSAALSILKVSQGSAEYYFEKNIMIWDIAAGIAILSGSGGKYALSNGSYPNSFNLVATNGIIK